MTSVKALMLTIVIVMACLILIAGAYVVYILLLGGAVFIVFTVVRLILKALSAPTVSRRKKC